jgi:hypothetical protein
MLIGRAAALGASAALSIALLVGCSGGDNSADEPAPTLGDTGNGLTPPGTKLGVDDAAVVGFAARRQKTTLAVTVTGLQRGKIKDLSGFDLKAAARESSVYYVRARVRNAGHHDVGGAFVKLYGRVSDTLVVQPVIFGSTFGKCDYKPLPEPFGGGQHADVCMVLLAPRHGSISAIEWRYSGDESDQAPITWELN